MSEEEPVLSAGFIIYRQASDAAPIEFLLLQSHGRQGSFCRARGCPIALKVVNKTGPENWVLGRV